MLAEETGVANVIDPLGGSWFVESLTDGLEEQCEAIFAQIEELSDDGTMLSGILRGIETGWFSSEIADAAFAFQNRLDKGDFKMVGVNAHTDAGEEQPLEILRISNEVGDRQVARLQQVKSERDDAVIAERLGALRAAADGEDNLVPFIIDAVRVDATVGEISDVLQEVWGTYTEHSVF